MDADCERIFKAAVTANVQKLTKALKNIGATTTSVDQHHEGKRPLEWLLVYAAVCFARGGLTATKEANVIACIDLLHNHGAAINTRHSSPLVLSVLSGSPAIVAHMLALGADPNMRCTLYELTSMEVACRLRGGNGTTIAGMLIEAGAEVSIEIVGLAAYKDNYETMVLLISAKGHPVTVDLMSQAFRGYLEGEPYNQGRCLEYLQNILYTEQ